jgi:hypothetical protein
LTHRLGADETESEDRKQRTIIDVSHISTSFLPPRETILDLSGAKREMMCFSMVVAQYGNPIQVVLLSRYLTTPWYLKLLSALSDFVD